MRTSRASRRSTDPALAALAEVGGRVAARVTPKASADRLEVGAGPDGAPLLRVWVTAPPEDGKANAAVVVLVAKALGVPKSAVTVARGAAGRDKLLDIAR